MIRHDEKIRQEAVNFYFQNKGELSQKKVASKFGIPYGTFCKWIFNHNKEMPVNTATTSKSSATLVETIVDLENKLATLKAMLR